MGDKGDSRLPADFSGRPEVNVSEQWAQRLLATGYPQATFTSVQSLQDAIRRAGEEVPIHREHGGMPPDIFQGLRASAEEQGGFLPLILNASGDALLQPTDDGALRISTGEETTDTGECAEFMLFDELDDNEFREETSHLDDDAIIEFVLRVTRIRDDLDLSRGLAKTWHRSEVPLDDVFERALDEGYVDAEKLEEAAQNAIDAQG